MNVIDSSAWLSYFAGDGNATMFAAPIKKLPELLVPGVTIIEVFESLLSQGDEEAVLIVIAHMKQDKVISCDSELAMDAAKFRMPHKLPAGR